MALVIALQVGACAAAPAPSAGVPTSGVAATAAPTPSPAMDPDISAAITFRTTFGLRSDEAYVVRVAADPTATTLDFGVPLLPAERDALQARLADTQATADIVRTYGESVPGAFGGLYIDAATGRVVALFTRDLDAHRAALGALLLPGSRVEFRAVRFTIVELTELQDRLGPGGGRDWAHGIGVDIGSSWVDVEHNTVGLVVQAHDPALLDVVAEHLQADGMLTFEWDTDWLAKLPRGAVLGLVVDAAGKPVTMAGLEVRAIGVIDGWKPDGDATSLTRADGSFGVLKLAEMGWTITILEKQAGLLEEIGSTSVVVKGGATAHVRITVTP